VVALGAGDAHRRDLAPQRTLGAARRRDEETKFVSQGARTLLPDRILRSTIWRDRRGLAAILPPSRC
jgi:hypothetical protein